MSTTLLIKISIFIALMAMPILVKYVVDNLPFFENRRRRKIEALVKLWQETQNKKPH